MVQDPIRRLLKVAGRGILGEHAYEKRSIGPGPVIEAILSLRNGFYAFESALHVFPSGRAEIPERSLEQWNSHDLWTYAYGPLVSGATFFAEDIFGGQFALRNGQVHAFDPETAKMSHLSDGLVGWCEGILDRYNYMTGFSVGHQWQSVHGALRAGHRLVPRVPFCFGGEFSADNMVPVESVAAMRYRASIAVRISQLPDGSQLRFNPAVIDTLACDRGGGWGRCHAGVSVATPLVSWALGNSSY